MTLSLKSGCLKRGNLVITTPSTSYSPTPTPTIYPHSHPNHYSTHNKRIKTIETTPTSMTPHSRDHHRHTVALTLAALTVLTGCALPSRQPSVTLTAAEVATIAETTAHNAAQEASLAHKLHREFSPDTDDVECWDELTKEDNGLYRVWRTYTFEDLDNTTMITSGHLMRDHLAHHGWTITTDRTLAGPGLDITGINDENGLYASIMAGNNDMTLSFQSGCLKRGNLVIITPSTILFPHPHPKSDHNADSGQHRSLTAPLPVEVYVRATVDHYAWSKGLATRFARLAPASSLRRGEPLR